VRILVTGFGPFGDVISNPSGRVARACAETGSVDALILPTSFARARAAILGALDGRDAVLMLGVASCARAFAVELIGRNADDPKNADVDGERRAGEIVVGGPETLPVTVDTDRIVEAIAKAGEPVIRSRSAGAYVCNHVLYSVLHAAHGSPLRAGFVHLPPDEITSAAAGVGLVRFERQVLAIGAAIDAIAKG
jgi:pyroglutamyl-peptidase